MGFYDKKIDSVQLSVLDTICSLFWEKRLNWLQQLLKFRKADECALQFTLEESLDKLSGHITLFLIRHLTIIYSDLNVFLKHFNSLCTGVDLCSILRFIQRVQLLLTLMCTRMAIETRMRSHFKYVIKNKLFSTCGSITHSASICLMTYSRCRQLRHTPSICLTWEEIIAVKFHLPSCSAPKILPYFATHVI